MVNMKVNLILLVFLLLAIFAYCSVAFKEEPQKDYNKLRQQQVNILYGELKRVEHRADSLELALVKCQFNVNPND